MKWNKRVIISAVLFLAAAGFSAMKLQEAHYIQSQYTTVSARINPGGIKESGVMNATAMEKGRGSEKIPEITAWVQLNEAEIKNEVLDRTEKLRIILFAGDMKVTAPMSLIRGSYVCGEDKKGCVIDKASAFRLFGTEAAVGNTLFYQNRYYYIRGVIKTIAPVLIIPGNSQTVYTNLEFYYQGRNKEQGEALAGEFLLQNGFTQEYVILDSYFYGRMLHSALILPVWIFFLLLCSLFMRYLWKRCRRLKPFYTILYCSIGLICSIGYGMLLYQYSGNPVYIPEKLIPTKFSDFGFFSELGRRLKEQLQQYRYLMPNPRDVFLEQRITGLGYNLIIILMLYISLMISCKSVQKKY